MSAAYDQYNYSSYWAGREYEHESEVIALKAFLNKIPKIDSIIEVGAGFGRLTPYYVYRAKKVLLTDPSAKLLKEARQNLRQYRKLKFIQSKLENLPRKLNYRKFKLTIMIRVMHHIEDQEAVFEAIDKLTLPNGYLILEFANKIHWKAVLKNFSKGDFTFPIDIFPANQRTKQTLKKHNIPFLNFHPDTIRERLARQGFRILEMRSVSNVRSEFFKRHFPVSLLLSIEKLLQKPMAFFRFGPSIFVLARKY